MSQVPQPGTYLISLVAWNSCFLKDYILGLIFTKLGSSHCKNRHPASLKANIYKHKQQLSLKNQCGGHILKLSFQNQVSYPYHVDADVDMWVVEGTQGPQVVEHGWVSVCPAADQKTDLHSVVESCTSQGIVNGWPVSAEKEVSAKRNFFEQFTRELWC